MQPQLLIDDLVRQTTVLIAQLSTAAGSRSPLSQIADQVFRELSRELEAQGVRQQVVADMFGLALRSYQLKRKRVTESTDVAGGTLWQELFADLAAKSATRQELERRHSTHSPRQIGATLQDMVKSGLAYSSGQGSDTLFGLTSESDRKRLNQREGERALVNMVWYLAASGSANTREAIAEQLRVEDEALDEAIKSLSAEGRLTFDGDLLRAKRFEVGVNAEQGWEAAVCDHFRAVATALAAKVTSPGASDGDQIGGGTVSFRVNPNHPHAAEVYALLRDTRERTSALWSKVAAFNEAKGPRDDDDRVTFYFGQNVVRSSSDAGATTATGVTAASNDVEGDAS